MHPPPPESQRRRAWLSGAILFHGGKIGQEILFQAYTIFIVCQSYFIIIFLLILIISFLHSAAQTLANP
jgi:hypothetical protein